MFDSVFPRLSPFVSCRGKPKTGAYWTFQQSKPIRLALLHTAYAAHVWFRAISSSEIMDFIDEVGSGLYLNAYLTYSYDNNLVS